MVYFEDEDVSFTTWGSLSKPYAYDFGKGIRQM